MLERTDVQLWATQRLVQAEAQRDHAWWLKTRRRPERAYNATPTTTLDRDPYNGVRVGEASTLGPDAHPFDDLDLGPCSEVSDDDFQQVSAHTGVLEAHNQAGDYSLNGTTLQP